MYALRLNDVRIRVENQHVFIADIFGDMQEGEVRAIIDYLVLEGFINPEKEINVFIQSKSLFPGQKKASQKEG